MAKKPSVEDIRRWQARLDASAAWRKPHEDRWKRNTNYLKNQFESCGEENQITVNMVHANIRVAIPSTYFRNPDLLIKARRDDFAQQAQAMHETLKYLSNELPIKKRMKLVILDAMATGIGWMKVGYQTDFEEIEAEQKKYSLAEKIVRKLKSMAGKAEYEDSTYSTEPDINIQGEFPWIQRVSPFLMSMPAYSTNPDTMPWIAESYYRYREDVKDDPRFDRTARKKVTPSKTILDLLKSNNPNIGLEELKSDEIVLLHEVWNARGNCIYTFADGQDECLEYKENPYDYLDNWSCYYQLRFNEIPDECYPMDDVFPYEAQQLELNHNRTAIAKHNRRFNRKYTATSGDFSEDELNKLTKGDDGSIIITTADDARAALAPIQDANISGDIYKYDQIIKDDINTISNISAYQRGSAEVDVNTATEAAIIQGQQQSRKEERLDIIGDFYADIMRALSLICMKNLPKETVVSMIGQKLAMSFPHEEDEDILRKEFIFDVRVGSSAPPNREMEAQRFFRFYELAKGNPIWDQIKLELEFGRQSGIAEPENWVSPEVAQALQSQQIMELMNNLQAMNQSPNILGPDGKPAQRSSPTGDGALRAPTPTSIRRDVNQSGNPRIPGGLGGRKLA